MNRFAWVQVAVQALAIDGKGSQKDVHKRGHRQKENTVYIKDIEIPTPIWAENQRARRDSTKEAELAKFDVVSWNDSPPPPRETPAVPRMVTSAEVEGRATVRSVATPLAVRSSKSVRRRSAFSIRKEIEEEPSMPAMPPMAPIPLENDPAAIEYASDSYFQPRPLKRRNDSSSTIFENSPQAPVTIIVTTPPEDYDYDPSPPPTPIASPRNSNLHSMRPNPNSSTMSLPSTRFSRRFSTDSLPLPQSSRLDPNRLMPPTEHQIDARRLRKAQEFREIRKFLIHFMNAKGDQFPKKLRSRMMEAYAIFDADLAPDVVARFNAEEVRDEGVALEAAEGERETTDADDLRILSMAFQSQMPVVPSRKDTDNISLPPLSRSNSAGSITRPARLSLPPRSSVRPTLALSPTPPEAKPGKASLPLPQKASKTQNKPPIPKLIDLPKTPPLLSQTTEAVQTPEDEPLSLSWLGPLITTSTPPLPSNSNSNSPSPEPSWTLPHTSDEKARLQKAHSTPDLSRRSPQEHPPIPGLPTALKNNSSATHVGRGRGTSVSDKGRGISVEKTMHIARTKRQGIIAGAFGAVFGGRERRVR